MDPICHTLVGAALAESGLKKRTALGTATLLIGANLPDMDVLSLLWGAETALWFRRGVTHGLFAVALLPFALLGLMMVWERLLRRRRRARRAGRAPPFRPTQVLLLSLIAVATHPALDYLNVYGMRWLYPFSERWHYGDTLFIVDPWVWVILAAGVLLARRGRASSEAAAAAEPARRRMATFAPRLSLLVLAAYIAGMGASNWLGRRLVTRSVASRGITPVRLMVAPVAVNPFRRWVVIEGQNVYHFGTLRWFSRPRLELFDLTYEKFPSSPVAAAATRGPLTRKFLSWARFPYDVVEEGSGEYVVNIGDARYTLDPKAPFGAISVRFDKR